MKRLRHPIRAIREPFGTAGLIVACVALIAALGGTALAAAKLNGTQKKEVEKIAKKFAGKPGAPGAAGANGTNGTNGAKGDTGAPGSNGTNGTPGTPGTPGAPGKSVTSTPIPAEEGEALCEERGGVEYLVEGAPEGSLVCNGKEGSPWVAGGALPPGAVETGTYFDYLENESNITREIFVAISFPIPMAYRIPVEEHVFFGTGGEPGPTAFKEHCPGSYAEPKVKNAGDLCIYDATGGISGAIFGGTEGILSKLTIAGGPFIFLIPKETSASIRGSFAVKGCDPVSGPEKCPE